MSKINIVLGFLWLATGVGILGYEFVNGPSGFRIRGLDVSTGWFFLVLAGWNFVRWYSSRAWREEQQALRIAHEARLREARRHERPAEPDPTFDFTDKPAQKKAEGVTEKTENVREPPPGEAGAQSGG